MNTGCNEDNGPSIRRNIPIDTQIKEDQENLSQALRNWTGTDEGYKYLLERLQQLKRLIDARNTI